MQRGFDPARYRALQHQIERFTSQLRLLDEQQQPEQQQQEEQQQEEQQQQQAGAGSREGHTRASSGSSRKAKRA